MAGDQILAIGHDGLKVQESLEREEPVDDFRFCGRAPECSVINGWSPAELLVLMGAACAKRSCRRETLLEIAPAIADYHL